MTAAETREKLRVLYNEAKAAGLAKTVFEIDAMLGLVSARAIEKLEAALVDPGLQRQHENIVESLDAEPAPPKPPVAPPMRKPIPAAGAPPAARKTPPSAPRRVTGPDAMDAEIPF
ncbi:MULTISPECIES: hypothetical protein [Hyphomicrobiales]|jgi:SOS-response transcriptional repressor LexA|uniref:hypothetical protein n=1 Tax=Methylobacterium sp. CCH7-A2 TaxID=1768789 RepID=UPI00082B5113|nr:MULTISPECIES: hypothetical protein [Hyphomicrobiales]